MLCQCLTEKEAWVWEVASPEWWGQRHPHGPSILVTAAAAAETEYVPDMGALVQVGSRSLGGP